MGATANNTQSSPPPSSKVQRTVRVLDVSGSAKEIGVSPVGRVSSLMEAVEEAFGVSLSRQRLICHGRIMNADEPLSKYKLGSGSTVHLCPRATDQPAPATVVDNTTTPAPLTRRRDDPFARLLDEDDLEPGVMLDFHDTAGLVDLADMGTPREFVWGFVMGFVLGFIMLLYLWERSVSHRQKMGILAGATAQLFVKYVHSAAQAAQAGQPADT